MSRRPFESKVQDLVYNIDTGFGLRLIQIGLCVLVLLTVMLLFTATQFRGLKDADAMDAAQLGRNLMLHKRYVTQHVRPASMGYLAQHRGGPQVDGHPELFRPPVYPAILAAGFRALRGSFNVQKPGGVYPPEQWIIVPINHLFTLLTGAMLFLAARRLFNFRTAAVGLAIFFLSRMVWDDSVSCVGLPVVSFFVTSAFYFALLGVDRQREGRPAGSWAVPLAVSAACVSLAALTRYGALAVLPGLLLYLALSLKRRRALVTSLYAALAVALLVPWFARNAAVCGNPFGLALHSALSGSRAVPADVFDRVLAPELTAGGILRALQVKWLTNTADFYGNRLFSLGDGLLFSFFLAAFFFRFVRRDVHVFRWCLGVSMLSLLFAAAFYGESTFRLVHAFWPFVILYGLAFFFLLLERLQLRARLLNIAVTVLFAGLSVIPLVLALLPPRVGVPYPPYFPPFITHVCGLLDPGEVLCTDMPWATAWYGERTSVLLPQTVDEFYAINDYQRRISGLYFTTITRDKAYARVLRWGEYRTWFPILQGRIPGDFPLTQGFPLNNGDQLFLTDRPRWTDTDQPDR